MIEFKNVNLQYVKEFYSLCNFNQTILNHSLFVGDFFDGTNSIMRILSKIDKDYTGEVFVDNVNLKNIKDKDLSVAYLPEKPVFFKNKNIFENLCFPLKIRKINKNSAKNLIFSVFLELKKENFNFLDKYINIKNEELNNNLNLQIENILKLKVKKLTLSEQKIIALIRAILRKPKYILLENFFEDLDELCLSLAVYLINKLRQDSIIIACEKEIKEALKEFDIINFSNEKKEA